MRSATHKEAPITTGAIELHPQNDQKDHSRALSLPLPADKQLESPREQLLFLATQVQERDQKISELALLNEMLSSEKSVLASRDLEKSNLITALESQKIALETKVSYMLKQIQDFESLRAKFQEASSTTSAEAKASKEELAHCQQKLQLSQSELFAAKRQLESCKVELACLREEKERVASAVLSEKQLLQASVDSTGVLLEEERKLSADLGNQLKNAIQEIDRLSAELGVKEADLSKYSRAMSQSIDSLKSPSLLGLETQSVDEVFHRRKAMSAERSLKALKGECERLAIENAHIKAESHLDYIRNIVLRYLQLPEQRQTLLPVLAKLFHFTNQELASFSK